MIRQPPTSTPFPTRRSSDLDLDAAVGAHLRAAESSDDPADHLSRAAEIELGRGRMEDAIRIAERALAEDPDRKSTRLNSSHSQISYAVFCLKKKNQIKCNFK